MPKRVTYLRKRPTLDRDAFRTHWESVHGPIAARFAHLEAYRQNVITDEFTSRPVSEAPVDGIVELWFESLAGNAPGRDPDVTEELVADEPRFLAGLVGSAVEAEGPYPPSRYKAWFVGQWANDDITADRVVTAAEALQQGWKPAGFTVRTQHVPRGTERFTREALDSAASLHDAAIIVCLGDRHPSPIELYSLGARGERALDGILRDVRCYLAEEIVIV